MLLTKTYLYLQFSCIEMQFLGDRVFCWNICFTHSDSDLHPDTPQTHRGKNTFPSVGWLMGTQASYSYVVRMFFPSSVQNWILWKQTEWHVYKYGCLPSGQASLCHVGPITSWWNLVISESGDRKRIKGKWRRMEVSFGHPVKCLCVSV